MSKLKNLLLISIVFVVALPLILVPNDAHGANRALVSMWCWKGSPPLESIPGPSPTIGCTALWGPGGDAMVLTWAVDYACFTTNCEAVTIEPVTIETWLMYPPNALKNRFLPLNCFGSPALAAVVGVGFSWWMERFDLYVDQTFSKTATELIPPYCPGGQPSPVELGLIPIL